MNEVATITKTLLIDRGRRKVRISYMDRSKMLGCIVPV